MSFLAGEARSLGISAKSLHTLKPKINTKPSGGALQSKAMRYALQRQAQSLMFDYNAAKQHRVCGCSRNVASDGVAVYRTVSGSNARFGNLMTCGSVWACPICAAKVTEARRDELQKAISKFIKSGDNHNIALMTLTIPHQRHDDLKELLSKFAIALQSFKNSRTYKNLFGTPKHEGEFRRIGSVRSLEVTHGVNGWHPHTHDLVFLREAHLIGNSEAIHDLKEAWVKSVKKAKLALSSDEIHLYENGLDVRGGDYAAEYVAKFGHEPKLYNAWSAAHEVTKQHSKAAVNGEHATPFMLLNWSLNGDARSGRLFREFVNCFDGKRMNYWSPNLRKALGLNDADLTDEEIAQADEPVKEDEEIAIRLDVEQWKLVLETNARAEVLEQAAAFGGAGVLDLLDDLRRRPKVGRGWFKDNARPDMSRFYH